MPTASISPRCPVAHRHGTRHAYRHGKHVARLAYASYSYAFLLDASQEDSDLGKSFLCRDQGVFLQKTGAFFGQRGGL
jgi:hypothetical protein